MAEEKKAKVSSSMENRVCSYLKPQLKKRFDDFVLIQKLSQSEVVEIAIKAMLDKVHAQNQLPKNK